MVCSAKAGFTTRTVHLVVEVKATCLPPAQKQAIARSVSHSNDTAEKHYRALDRGKTILAYKSVGSILGAPVAEKPVVEATPLSVASTLRGRWHG